jgi:hypothetical protein
MVDTSVFWKEGGMLGRRLVSREKSARFADPVRDAREPEYCTPIIRITSWYEDGYTMWPRDWSVDKVS